MADAGGHGAVARGVGGSRLAKALGRELQFEFECIDQREQRRQLRVARRLSALRTERSVSPERNAISAFDRPEASRRAASAVMSACLSTERYYRKWQFRKYLSDVTCPCVCRLTWAPA
jgi:hypothetical protein